LLILFDCFQTYNFVTNENVSINVGTCGFSLLYTRTHVVSTYVFCKYLNRTIFANTNKCLSITETRWNSPHSILILNFISIFIIDIILCFKNFSKMICYYYYYYNLMTIPIVFIVWRFSCNRSKNPCIRINYIIDNNNLLYLTVWIKKRFDSNT
jgi:hypothetical protein